MNMHQIMSVVALEYVGAGFGYRFDGGVHLHLPCSNINDKQVSTKTSQMCTMKQQR
jgi:hypothetical protein